MKLPITLLLILSSFYSIAQHHINKDWETHTGLPVNLHWQSSIVSSTNYLITVGNTFSAGQDANVLLTKHTSYGDIVWQTEYNSPDSLSDYGISVCEDAGGNYLVAATSLNSASSYDIVVLKYNSSGQLQWEYTFDGTQQGEDIPSQISSFNNEIVVCGLTKSSGTATDFITIKLNSQGIEEWTNTYDYNSLDDAATGLYVNPINGDITVTGGSATQANIYDAAVVQYDQGGFLLSSNRSNYGIGLERPSCFAADTSGNLIVGGWYTNNETEISIFSLDDTLGMNWDILHNPSAQEDKIMDLVVDESGHIYVTGHSQHPLDGFQAYIARFSSQGVLEWEKTYLSPTGGSFGKKIRLDQNGNVLITGMAYGWADTNIITLGFKSTNGALLFSKEYDHGGHEVASNMELDNWGNIYIHGTTTNGGGYVTLKYTTFVRNMSIITDTVDSLFDYAAGEILISFDTSDMITTVVNNDGKVFGQLSEFVSSSITGQLNSLFEGPHDWGRFHAIKIHPKLKSTDTISISRLGDTIRIPPFWSSLLVLLPSSFEAKYTAELIDTALYPAISSAEVNGICYLNSFPNDSIFTDSLCLSLHDTVPTFGNYSDINIIPAWEHVVGNPDIRVGVFDGKVNWSHEDFSLTGSGSYVDSKIQGWDYSTESPLSSDPTDTIHHGTYVAGLIGALRNNYKGIPGVVGGDMSASTPNPGASIYSMQIFDVSGSGIGQDNILPAIVEGVTDNPNSNQFPGYALDVLNNSWHTTAQNSELLRQAVFYAADNECSFIAASGNLGDQTRTFPASFKDEFVMKVGASNFLGVPTLFSGYGNSLDFIAPGASGLYYCPSGVDNSYTDSYPGGQTIEGTSFSAPHLSGSVALVQSYRKDNNLSPLSPEDIEQLFQEYSTDIADTTITYLPVGYDANSGWGKINTGLTVEHILAPKYSFQHSKFSQTISASITPIATNQLRTLSRKTTGLSAGDYLVDVYEVTITQPHYIGTNNIVIGAWERDARCNLWADTDPIVPEPNMHVTSYSSTGITMRGYFYLFKNLGGIPFFHLPIAPGGKAHLAYTLHLDDESITLDNVVKDKFNASAFIFPNPSNNLQTLVLNLEKMEKVKVQQYAVDGSLIRTVFYGNIVGEKRISLPPGDPSGIYLYTVNSETHNFTLKSIIQ